MNDIRHIYKIKYFFVFNLNLITDFNLNNNDEKFSLPDIRRKSK